MRLKESGYVGGKNEVAELILEMRNISKQFPGVKALDNVTLQI